MASHDAIPRILPSDLPPEVIERLALAVNFAFSPRDVTSIRRAKSFLDALRDNRHGWGGNYLAGLIEELEYPNCAVGNHAMVVDQPQGKICKQPIQVRVNYPPPGVTAEVGACEQQV